MATPHRASWPLLAVVSAQVWLMVAVVHQFRLENRGFLGVLLLVAVAFPLHALLPLSWRPGALLAISLSGFALVLSPLPALGLLAMGSLMIALCHLPIPWLARYALLLVVAGLLASLRADRLLETSPVLVFMEPLWPILGSMFMFRLLIYLHDLRHGRLPPSKVWSLNYFFLLPNVCFPLFPVVDYKRLRKTYYNAAADGIYRRGARWMVRGLWQLVLYRGVYHHLALDPAEVQGSWMLLQYMVASFLLYLRVSGHFHLIIGILLLFGCNLPETHQRYFLASSLSDFWRRINIYWKDFMAKIFFFPSHDRLRRWGPRWALAIATAWVFFATWWLHAYQWFWLTGSGLLTWSDVLFWLILGGLVVINVLWESRPGRPRGPQHCGEPWARAMRIVATFLFLTVLWSLWTTDSLALWLHLWSTAPELAPILAVVIVGLLTLAPWVARQGQPRPKMALGRSAETSKNQGSRDLLLLMALAVFFLLGRPQVQGRLATLLPSDLGGQVATIGESLRSNELNRRDAADQRRGYYEQLIAVPLDNPGLHQLYAKSPPDWLRIDETTAWRPAEGLRRGELVPGARIEFKQAPMTVNRWGMRDRDYPKERSPDLPRLAIMGSSHAMGSGVADGDTFESLFEDRFNDSVGPLEVLNFAVAGHSTIEDMDLLERRILDFRPDTALEVAHTHDVDKGVRFLARHLASGESVEHPVLSPILTTAGAAPGQARTVLEHRLRPHRWEILSAVYTHMADLCRQQDIDPWWVLLPLVGEEDTSTMDRLVTTARDAGWNVLDLRHVYDGHAVDQLRLAPWDQHPNTQAHRLIAEALFETLRGMRIHPSDRSTRDLSGDP